MALPLTLDEILAARDLKTELVDVPEWSNGELRQVRVRGLSVGDHETLSALRQGVEKVDEVWMYRHICDLCALCIVDEAGKRLLTPAAVEQLKQEHAVEPLLRIWEAARRLSGLTATQEDLEKN